MYLGPTSDFISGEEVYAISTSGSTIPAYNTTNWKTTYTVTNGYYLWTATRVQYYNSSSYDYLNAKCVGYWGTDGASISSANVYYALTTSDTTTPNDSAFTYDDFPPLDKDKYIWQATKVTYSNGNSEYTAKFCLGSTSDFVSGVEVYAISASNTSTPAD